MSGKKVGNKTPDLTSAKKSKPTSGLHIRVAEEEDAADYQRFCADIIKSCYLVEDLGYSQQDFDEEKFYSKKQEDYFKEQITFSKTNICILAEINGKIIGSIALEKMETHNQILGPHISKDYQGLGIGLKLWAILEKVINNQPVVVHVPAVAWGILDLYMSRAFRIDPAHPYRVVSPDWLKAAQGMQEYRLVRNVYI